MKFLKRVIGFMRPGREHLAALVLGGLAVMAFAPFAYSPVMLGSLAGLFALWMKAATPSDGAKLGLWYGLGLFGVGVSWLFSSIYLFAEVLLPLAVLLTFGWVLYLSLFIAAAGWMSVKFKSRPALTLLGLFPALWVLFELLRGMLFGGYPFLLTGVSHLHTWLDGYAPILGVWGMSWALALSAGALVLLFTRKTWILSSIVLALVWTSGGMLQKVEWVEASGKPIDIALLQGNVPQDRKWLSDEFFPTLERYIGMTKMNLDADVIVWPETAVPAYFDIVHKGALRSFIADAKLLQKDILVGVIAGGRDSEDYYNALINVGKVEDRYYKHHLVPFSEYFPFDSAFRFLSGLFEIPYATFSAGSADQQPIELGGHKAGLSICFEMAFGEELARQLPQAEYLVTVSNDAWFAHTLEPAQQLQDVQMRALELGREIARATNTGYTAVVGVDGRIKAEIAPYQEGVLRAEVQPYQGLTPYAQWQRLPIVLLVGLILLFSLSGRLFKRKG